MNTSERSTIGQLFVIATPIGNLEDISKRALRILGEVDRILAEDTRVTKKLLNHFGIDTPCSSFHDHNEDKLLEKILEGLESGESIALVSDAGTPLISDPGFKLTRACHEHGIQVSPIPGASALTAAISAMGIPSDSFTFLGFLSQKQKARREALDEIRVMPHTVILYESPKRIEAFLEDCVEVLGDTRIIGIARELTKKFETIKKATAPELLSWMQQDSDQTRGEFVVVIEGNKNASGDTHAIDAEKCLKILLKELGTKQAAKIAAELTGLPSKELYSRALELKR